MDTEQQRFLGAIERRPRTVEETMTIYNVEDPDTAADLLQRQERVVAWMLAHPDEPLTDRGIVEDLLLLGGFRFGKIGR